MDLSQSRFMYLLSVRRNEALFPRAEPVCFGKTLLQLPEQTDLRILREGDREICVVGLCVDSLGELSRDDVPEALLAAGANGLDALLEIEARMAGRYLILFSEGGTSWAVNDATGAMQVFYHAGEEPCLASLDALVARTLSLPEDEEHCRYQAGSDHTQAMPYNVTYYRDVLCLLPGHALSLFSGEVRRYWKLSPPAGDTDAVLEKTARQIDAITRAYAEAFRLVCPITGGWDSRTNLSFLLKNAVQTETYTLFHPGFTEDTADIAIPRAMTARLRIPHRVIPDAEEDPAFFEAVAEITGPHISRRNVVLARSCRLAAGPDCAILSGDTVAQIGKHLFGHRLPWYAATAGFLTCKLHSTAPGVKPLVRQQLREYADSGCRKAAFDLFALESRCGRWASQAYSLYDIVGVHGLNQYNCRSVLAAWMSLPKELRADKGVHKYYLRRNAPELLEYPFNAPSWQSKLKDHAFTYWCATYGKYYLQLWHDRFSR